MSKEIDLVKCIISEIDNNLWTNVFGDICIRYTSNLQKLLLALDTPEVRHFFENYNHQSQRISDLEEQLKKKPKYNVGDRVYVINEDNEVERDFVESIDIDTDGIEYYTEMYSICWYENQLFKTEEDALAKLKELGE